MLWPLVIYFIAATLMIALILSASYLLGQRHADPATPQQYEGGIRSTGSARVRLSVRFYLVAMFFIIFDLEAAFIFAWVVAVHESGWAGYWEIFVFIVVLAAALVYLWRSGGLDWAPERRLGRRRVD